jgi:hypothetical protein
MGAYDCAITRTQVARWKQGSRIQLIDFGQNSFTAQYIHFPIDRTLFHISNAAFAGTIQACDRIVFLQPQDSPGAQIINPDQEAADFFQWTLSVVMAFPRCLTKGSENSPRADA